MDYEGYYWDCVRYFFEKPEGQIYIDDFGGVWLLNTTGGVSE